MTDRMVYMVAPPFELTSTARTGASSFLPDDDRRLDPGLGRLTQCTAPPANTRWNLVVGLTFGFTFAMGLLLIMFGNKHMIEAIGFLSIGGLGLGFVRYLDRHM
jgi:hypothetical protein